MTTKKTILAIALILVSCFTVFAQQPDPESDFEVEVIDNGRAIRITGYIGNRTAVNIPPRIRNLPVTEIGRDAFRAKGLTGVTIPDGVVSIDFAAFFNNQLVSVTIPNSVISIGSGAFRNNQITNVIIPNSVTSIERYAFMNNQLTSVTIGNRITSIEDSAFRYNQLTSIIIPDSVTSIMNWAFANNQLTTVTIGNRVETVGNNAFFSNLLASVTIPANVTIAPNAFDDEIGVRYNNLGRRALYLENGFIASVTADGRGVGIVHYSGTSSVISIPSHFGNLPVTEIGVGAFWDKGLTAVTIPNSVTSIGRGAFTDRNNTLTQITLSANVNFEVLPFGMNFEQIYEETGRRAGTYYRLGNDYMWCEFIENGFGGIVLPDGRSVSVVGYSGTNRSITIPERMNNLPVVEIRRRAFQFKELSSVVIPNSVTTIGAMAFEQSNLTSVTLGNSVRIIEERAFQINPITSVVIPNSVTIIGAMAFGNTNLSRIAIGNDVRLGDGGFVAFDSVFDGVYNQNGRRSGTYTRSGIFWSRQ